MNQKLTPSPVAPTLVAVEPLSQDGRELDWEEVKDIWPELPLPYRLVDRVRVSSERRETLPVPRKGQKPSLAIPFADLLRGMATFAQVGLMGAMVASIIWVNDRKEAIANRIAHPQNLYQTKLTNHNVWTSACSYQLGDKAKPGTWQVKMYLGDRAVWEQYRLLTQTEFIVE